MALAIDTSTGASDLTGSATSLTWSHTCTGSDLVLFVSAATNGNSDRISGITYNGVAMTRVPTNGFVGDGSTQPVSSYMYYLINPATGAHNVVISVPGNSSNISGDSMSYTGAYQVSQPDSSAKNNGSGATLALTTTVVASGCWLLSTFMNLNARSAPGGTTGRGANGMTVDSNGTVSTGSNTHTWGGSAGSAATGIIVSIAPVPTPVTARRRALLGVGL